MKKLLFICLAIAVVFSACKKEEETPTNNTATAYAFSCKTSYLPYGHSKTVSTPLTTP